MPHISYPLLFEFRDPINVESDHARDHCFQLTPIRPSGTALSTSVKASTHPVQGAPTPALSRSPASPRCRPPQNKESTDRPPERKMRPSKTQSEWRKALLRTAASQDREF